MITLLFQSILILLMLALSFFLGYKIAWRKRGAEALVAMLGGHKPTIEDLGAYAREQNYPATGFIEGYFGRDKL